MLCYAMLCYAMPSMFVAGEDTQNPWTLVRLCLHIHILVCIYIYIHIYIAMRCYVVLRFVMLHMFGIPNLASQPAELLEDFDCDKWRGPTRTMILSEVQGQGHDLSKIAGFDPKVIIEHRGWDTIGYHLVQMMQASQWRKLESKLTDGGLTMSRKIMSRLNRMAAAPAGRPAQ